MDRRGSGARSAATLLVCAVLALLAAGVDARTLWTGTEEETGAKLLGALKSSLLVDRAPEDPLLFPDRDAGAALWRFRLEPSARPLSWFLVDAAYESWTTVGPATNPLAGGAVLGTDAPPPYRIRPLHWFVAGAPDGLDWRQEIDRGFVSLRGGPAEATLGRQAVGWGRGVLFSAADVFAPFSPLEADREWRRGIDAARLEVKLSDRSSMDGVAAFGESTTESAFALRARGYAGDVDGEILGGVRARDLFAGLTGSGAVGGAEVHGEAVLFRLPDPLPDRGPFSDPRLVAKGVLGASYLFRIGSGLTVEAEAHYSGFGVPHARDALARLLVPAYQARFLRGDTQILGREAFALVASYEASPELALSPSWIADPTDGSGVVLPAFTWTLSEAASLLGSVYLPYGAPPEGAVLRSFYGATPLTGFLQIRLYD